MLNNSNVGCLSSVSTKDENKVARKCNSFTLKVENQGEKSDTDTCKDADNSKVMNELSSSVGKHPGKAANEKQRVNFDIPDNLEKLTVIKLRSILRNFGMRPTGSKQELIEALRKLSHSHGDNYGSDRNISNIALQEKLSEENEIADHASLPIPTNSQNINTTNRQAEASTEGGMSAQKRSSKKRRIMKKTENEDLDISFNLREDPLIPDRERPWTLLAHKKPSPEWVAYNPSLHRHMPLLDGEHALRLISWNVNGLRALLKRNGDLFSKLAERENFDVLCLQETKLKEIDVEQIKRRLSDDYDNSFWSCSVSKLGYSGTAVISRIKPQSVLFGLGVPDHDSEGRLITIEFETIFLVVGYVPNAGQKLERLTYRVEQWDPALCSHIKDLEKKKPVILTGDLNCAHEEIDIYNPDGNHRSAGFTDEERKSFEDNFLNRGFVDSFRQQHPNSVAYTYWGYRQNARKKNKGWRLDYFLVSDSIADNIYDSYTIPDIDGSDHCPIGLVLKY